MATNLRTAVYVITVNFWSFAMPPEASSPLLLWIKRSFRSLLSLVVLFATLVGVANSLIQFGVNIEKLNEAICGFKRVTGYAISECVEVPQPNPASSVAWSPAPSPTDPSVPNPSARPVSPATTSPPTQTSPTSPSGANRPAPTRPTAESRRFNGQGWIYDVFYCEASDGDVIRAIQESNDVARILRSQDNIRAVNERGWGRSNRLQNIRGVIYNSTLFHEYEIRATGARMEVASQLVAFLNGRTQSPNNFRLVDGGPEVPYYLSLVICPGLQQR